MHIIGVRLGVPLVQFQHILKEKAHIICILCASVCACGYVCCDSGRPITFIWKLISHNISSSMIRSKSVTP